MSSKRRRHQTLAMGLLASLMAPVAWAQTGAEQTLLDQGQYWQERGDTERAGEAWQKLLRINPQNAQALYGMALVELNAPRPLALEYYQTLGATAGGWDEARRGLNRLAQESPEDPQIALALAQHLTYRESTRREGIAQLARLAGRADVGKAATESWRKALAWTGNRSADIP